MTTSDPTPPELRLALAVRAVAALADDDHVAELLDRLTDVACTLVDAADHCGITLSIGDVTFTAAASSTEIAPINDQQYSADDGPCLHAARTAATIVVDCTVDDDRWPHLGPAARRVGINTMLCAPIVCDDRPVGSLTLFARAPQGFDDLDHRLVELLTGVTADALERARRRRELHGTIAGLRDALVHRAPIEQAKGILMALRGIDEDAAFTVLSTRSQHLNRKVRDIATEFVESVSAAAPTGDL
ncbi:GAF and ANTAR domain-containing protein [Rhodococcus sp. BP-316]|uniref:GAF and ANTAR domain-containing protein n=1 Tax=unclassified Rhodococcus (in: high G+C Gram-positive bacteria) TaxID=192944 RepID=UPI000689B756|nr:MULTISPECIES: GAF and ANTAR domain-containing protein [unclassified Rhodococcus (in: high G+C Gram-positive bacteria)]MBY6682950.1 GAF and ANTAR domain-containing protein [Rhodococcus sp. BP-316]